MKLSQKVALNTAIQIFSKATTVIFGLLTMILLIDYLGKEGYGDYMYVITLVVMFGVFADWGTGVIGVREASRTKEKQGQVLANIFMFRLVLAFMAAVFMVLAALFLPLRTANPVVLRQAIMLGALILVLFATKASFGIVFQTKLVMQNLAVADIASSALVFLISWLFVQQGLGLLLLVGAVVLANIFAVVIAWFLAQKTVRFVFRLDRLFIKRLIRESLPMGAILLMFTVDNKIDTVMLGSIKGSGPVGIYAVAYRIYDVLILGAAYLMNALLPVLSQYSNINKWGSKLRQIYQKTFDILFLMGLGLLLTVWLFAPLVVQIITQRRFGEFSDSVLVLRILSLALFLAYLNHLTGFTIIALGRQRPYFFIALAALIFNVFANLIVIPKFSFYGAATVTVLTEGLVLLITTAFIFRLIKIIPSLVQFPKTAIQLIKERGKLF